MVRRHPLPPKLPRAWLFSDERTAVAPLALAALLPPGSGIILRHDRLAPGARWRLARRLARIARARRLRLLLAGDPACAARWGMDGVHLRQAHSRQARQAHRLGLMLSMPVHDAREALTARRAGAQAAFVSPLHPTRSHPGSTALGYRAWLRLARTAGGLPVALGGMTSARWRALGRAGAINAGWAAIDAWDERAAKRRSGQKRKAVPT